jgi:predicted permease
MMAAFTVTAGLLLALGLGAVPTGAAVASTGKTAPAAAAATIRARELPHRRE